MPLWATLSFVSAFGQALGWALKKKALAQGGLNNVLGAVSFAVAGVLLSCAVAISGLPLQPLSDPRFIMPALGVIALNVIAAWSAYRALDIADFSALMPFMSLTAVAIVPVEYLLRGTTPTFWEFAGIVIIVLGSIISMQTRMEFSVSSRAAAYFAITLFCYSVSSPLMGVAVIVSGSGLLAAAAFHVGIALGFIPLVIISGEMSAVRGAVGSGSVVRITAIMAAAGVAMALLENGPATIALQSATAAQVFSIKRTMPLFALVLGAFMFHERIGPRRVSGTVLLVVGAALIILF